MRRKAWQIAVVVLLMGVLTLLSACGKPKQEEQAAATRETTAPAETAGPGESFELAGDYIIDITDLGMALQFYLRINEDNTFVLGTSREFTSERGSGKIGELEGTYVMIYSDSTPEEPKTASFEREGHNLVFRSTLPYGSANIMYELQDEENPEIVHRLVAQKYVYEEYYDTYLAFVDEEGQQFDYVLTLGPGATYTFTSSLEGEEVYSEAGTFRVAGQTMTITPTGEGELTGSIGTDGSLELEFPPRAEAARSKTVFRVATTAEHAGRWYAQTAAGELAVLELDYFGGYLFTTGAVSERGSFSADQRTISFQPEAGEGQDGSKTPYTLEAVLGGEELVFFSEQILGQFSGGTMSSEAYTAQLELSADGSFTLIILDQENELELVNEAGSFQIVPGPMAYQLTLEAEATVRAGEIWPTGFNMAFNLDGTDYRFLLTSSAR